MEEADQLCDRVAIIDQGRIVALDTPAGLKRSVGVDATVRVVADGDLDALASCSAPRSPAPPTPPCAATPSYSACTAPVPCCHRVVHIAERNGFLVTDLSVSETTPRDRLHQPHRKGPPRMTVVDLPITSVAPTARLPRHPFVGVRRAAAARPHGAAQEPQGVHPAHDPPAAAAGVRVHLRLPEDRPGRRRQRRRGGDVLQRARRRRRGDRDPLPGHPGRRPAARAGVRLHPRDRGPSARPAAGEAWSPSRRSSPVRCSAWSPG